MAADLPDTHHARFPVSEQHDKISVDERQVSFPIVGIGASAGGLEAYQQLLANLPNEAQALRNSRNSPSRAILSKLVVGSPGGGSR